MHMNTGLMKWQLPLHMKSTVRNSGAVGNEKSFDDEDEKATSGTKSAIIEETIDTNLWHILQ